MNTVIVVEFGPKNVVEYVQISRDLPKRRYMVTCYDNVTPASAQRLANVCKPLKHHPIKQVGMHTIRHTITN